MCYIPLKRRCNALTNIIFLKQVIIVLKLNQKNIKLALVKTKRFEFRLGKLRARETFSTCNI